MNDKPILFSAPMVRALLEGRKTQTRRVVKPQPEDTRAKGKKVIKVSDYFTGAPQHGQAYYYKQTDGFGCWESSEPFFCPYGQPGDLLWVRENHYLTDNGDYEFAVYAEDEKSVEQHFQRMEQCEGTISDEIWNRHVKLRPSIHMPRWVSRITLQLSEVRVQRLQGITEQDAKAEGCRQVADDIGPATVWSYKKGFGQLWAEINGSESWNANPWVWALTFTVHHCNIDDFLSTLQQGALK